MVLHEQISNWILNYLKKNNIKTLVIGISGGIDSAVTSTLCAKTGYPTKLLIMPIYQNKMEINNANDHINWLEKLHPNVTSTTIDLTSVFEQFKKATPIKFQSLLMWLIYLGTVSNTVIAKG